MKIQLDSKALAYLIENSDEDFKLELQSSVVQAFANKYLKALVNHDIFQEQKVKLEQFINAAKNDILKEIYKTLGHIKSANYNNRYELCDISPGVRTEIQLIVKEQRELAIAQLIEKCSNGVTEEVVLKLLTDEYKKQIKEIVRKELIQEQITKLQEKQ